MPRRHDADAGGDATLLERGACVTRARHVSMCVTAPDTQERA
ncbi:MAG TPA: hypothetical protein VKH36_11675 [Acidimicrobiia bacterium]|nr:hypothetical protein [Acidimicrobiia bacterium]